MQRQGRQHETRASAAAEKPVKVAVQPDDRHRSEHGNRRGPGIPGQRYQREQDQSRERHADLLGGLDVQVGLDGSAALIRSIHGSPRRKMSVRTISGSDRRFR